MYLYIKLKSIFSNAEINCSIFMLVERFHNEVYLKVEFVSEKSIHSRKFSKRQKEKNEF